MSEAGPFWKFQSNSMLLIWGSNRLIAHRAILSGQVVVVTCAPPQLRPLVSHGLAAQVSAAGTSTTAPMVAVKAPD